MKRRKFLKTAGIAAAGAAVFPTILPSGRVFAQTGNQLAEHVVFVLFAGGVRHQESISMRYLADSQNAFSGDDLDVEGNIMYNMLTGAPPDRKIAYGTDIAGQNPGIQPISRILGQTLQEQGTLFREMTTGTAGHYFGLSALVSGSYNVTQGLRQKPVNPTVFEYVRRHMGEAASKVWFIGNGIGNSTPLLNYSEDMNYGADYGANFFAPNVTFGNLGQQHLENAKIYHPEEELGPMYEMKYFLDNSFLTTGGVLPGIHNTEEEKYDIKQFMKSIFERKQGMGAPLAMPPVNDNGDLSTVGYAVEVMKWFKPTLTVVNLSAVDGCHSNFSGYLKSLHRADHAVGHLWNMIESTPGMAGNTIMIAAPEHGRNLEPNPIQDENDWYAYDHSDPNALRNFGLMVGPGVDANLQLGSEGNPVGDTAQCALTIAEILGIKNDVMAEGKVISNQSLFDLI